MKKIFTSLCLAMASVWAMAADYTDMLTVSINGKDVAQQPATIVINPQDNGLYTLQLDNFMLGADMPVGNIRLTDVPCSADGETSAIKVTQQVTITPGNLPGLSDGDYLGPMLGVLPVCVNGELKGGELYAVISIDMTASLGQYIVCTFGTGGYQLKNSGFESFHTAAMGTATSDEPNNWHSFMSCGGDYANIVGTVPHTFISEEVRPGSLGSKSVLVKSGKVLGFVVANGTLTTGRLQAGAMSATDPKNCSFSNLSLSAADANGDPFFADFKGMPDSLTVWVKFSQGTLQKDHPYATVNAVITDGTYYQDPEDKAYDNYLAKATCATIESKEASWQRLSIPFVYEEGKNLSPKAMHVTISTNSDPGAGTGNDMLYVDDIALVYNCGISRLSVKGQDVAAKEGTNVYEAEVAGELIASDIEVTTDGKAAKADVRLEAMDGGVKAIVTVTAGDLKSNEYVLIAKGASLPAGISGIAAGSDRETLFYNVGGQRVGNVSGGLLIERNGNGARKILTK